MKICVIGAGIVGLTCVQTLFEKITDVKITLISESINKKTTSNGAAGLLRPPLESCKLGRKLFELSFTKYLQLFKDHDADNMGISLLSGYQFSDNKHIIENIWYNQIVLNYTKLSDNCLKKLQAHKMYGCTFTTLCVECYKYLPYLLNTFKAKENFTFIQKNIETLNDIPNILTFDYIINCCGINGYKFSSNKDEMVPVKGQIIRISAPWIKHFWYVTDGETTDFNTYIIPTANTVVLGGSREIGNHDTNIDRDVSKGIMDRCSAIIPGIQRSTILKEWAGLRPYRKTTLENSTPRIELDENFTLNNPEKRRPKLIHNYGHGGHGITYSYGSAYLVFDIIKEDRKKAKTDLGDV